MSASQLSQSVSESVEGGLSSQIFAQEQIINKDDKLCGFVYGFQKAIQPPLLSLRAPFTEQTGSEGPSDPCRSH